MQGFNGIAIKDEDSEEIRRASRIAEMMASFNRVFEEHGRLFHPQVAK